MQQITQQNQENDSGKDQKQQQHQQQSPTSVLFLSVATSSIAREMMLGSLKLPFFDGDDDDDYDDAIDCSTVRRNTTADNISANEDKNPRRRRSAIGQFSRRTSYGDKNFLWYDYEELDNNNTESNPVACCYRNHPENQRRLRKKDDDDAAVNTRHSQDSFFWYSDFLVAPPSTSDDEEVEGESPTEREERLFRERIDELRQELMK